MIYLVIALSLLNSVAIVLVHINANRRLKQLTEAISSTRAQEATDEQIAHFQKEMRRHPEGSPKHAAYKARLAALGH